MEMAEAMALAKAVRGEALQLLLQDLESVEVSLMQAVHHLNDEDGERFHHEFDAAMERIGGMREFAEKLLNG